MLRLHVWFNGVNLSSIIYLRKTKDLENSTSIEEIFSFYETPDEFINRMKTQSITPEFKRDINFHLKQLMEISVDTQLLYRWVRLNNPLSKINFFKQLLYKDNLFEILFFRNYHFSDLDFSELPEKLKQSLMSSYREFLDERYDYLRETVSDSIQYLKLDSNKPTIEKMDDIINSIINQGLFMNLGVLSKTYNVPRIISYNGKVCANYNYLNAEIFLCDKNTKTMWKEPDLEALLSDVSHYALDLYIKIWELLGTSERKNKNSKYASMTQEELISTFYKVYSGVPKNLLEILRTVDYDGKRILAENYHLQEHNRLLINYLYLTPAGSDYPLLEHLFQKQNLNSYYDAEYSSKKIKDFEDFLKSYK